MATVLHHTPRPLTMLLLIVILAISNSSFGLGDDGPISVTLLKTSSGWQLNRGGEPYEIRGGGWGEPLDQLQSSGGNSIRTWGVGDETLPMLDAAHARGMTVMVGLWMQHPSQNFDYTNTAAVSAQKLQILEQVNVLKDHPALLMWGVGNEVEMNLDEPEIWLAMEDVASAIKTIDPHHPTCAVTAEMGSANDQRLTTYCPSIDVWGINSYNSLSSLPARVNASTWEGPYVITEFGPKGDWTVPTTSWNAPYEQTSTDKANWYKNGWINTIAANSDRCLGGYAFVWRGGQSPTDTWFTMYTWDLRPTNTVDAMYEAWQGSPPSNRAPRISGITSSISGATITPGAPFQATISALELDGEDMTVEWFIGKDLFNSSGTWTGCSDTPICLTGSELTVHATAPTQPGTYRLFSFVEDESGRVGTASTPFRAEGEQSSDLITIPFAIDDYYIPSGWMGATSTLSVSDCESPSGACGGVCTRFDWTPSGPNWVGVLWQYPINNWGGMPGLDIASGATEIQFMAWANEGNPSVNFQVGNTHSDGFNRSISVTLGETPTLYSIPLAGVNYSNVIQGFGMTTSGSAASFNVSDVTWIGEETPCLGDFNEDGFIDGSDLAFILAGWGQSSSPYDLDGNGTVNGGDLAFILIGWGPCP